MTKNHNLMKLLNKKRLNENKRNRAARLRTLYSTLSIHILKFPEKWITDSAELAVCLDLTIVSECSTKSLADLMGGED